MPMMNVGVMYMGVLHLGMVVRVRVGFPGRVVGAMFVLVVLIVDVAVVVVHWLMLVFVFMVFGQVQPHTQDHKGRRHQKRKGKRVPKDEQR